MRICFLDSSQIPYNSEDLYNPKIRGAESILINLAKNFKDLGHEVCVFNNIENKININGIEWNNIKNISENVNFDIAITNNDINLFKKIISPKKIALSHSIQTIEKFIRQKQLLSYLIYRPKIVFMGNYHEKTRPFLLKIFGKIKVNWCTEEIFSKSILNNEIDDKKAIFTSYVDRNMELLINIWKTYIHPKNKSLKLFLTPQNKNLKNFNIFDRKFENKRVMLNDIAQSRLYLIPGHKAELFCFAAEEARELCVPIVTLGIGCLSERVDHNKTGFVAKNNKEFADYTIELFQNNKLWNYFRSNLINQRGKKSWLSLSKKFLNEIINE